MRLSLSTLICMLASIHLLWAIPTKGQALDEKKVTMEASNATLEKVLGQLEKLSGFRIAYASKNVAKYASVSLDFATRSVSATLKALLNNTDLGYKLSDNTIMIVSRHELPPAPVADQQAADTTVTIKGRVTDEAGMPMPGVSVRVKNTTKGVFTDAAGGYTLTVNRGDVIIFSSIGAVTHEHVAGRASAVNITLKADNRKLDDVVVIGYGTQRKANVTGAVSTVDVKKTLESRPLSDVGRGLQGAVPGLTITTTSGDLGRNPSIRLRGITGSLNSSGGARPLILVDNVEIPSLQMVNPQDIETISVLKDAASTSIYGTRAAWGVVLITTKSGKKGAPASINYSNNFSFSRPTKLPTMAPAAEGAETVLEVLRRSSNNPAQSQFGVLGMYFDDIGIQKIRDWEKTYGGQNLGPEMVMGRDLEIRDGKLFFYRPWDVAEEYMKKNTMMQKHDLSFTGGTEKTTFHVGLGYLNQNGVLKFKTDKFDRYNANVNVTTKVNDWVDVRGKIMLAQTNFETPFTFSADTYGPWYYLYRWPRIYPYGTLDGKSFRSALTEVQQANMNETKSRFNRVQVGTTLRPLKDLTIDVDYTYSATNTRERNVGGGTAGIDFWGGSLNYLPNYQSAAYDYVAYYSSWNDMNSGRAFATYTKSLGSHNVKVMVGTDVDVYTNGGQSSKRTGLIDPDRGELSLATGDQTVGGSSGHWATNGYFGRITYDYKNKFLLELNGRYDGSSRFPKNDQYAFFKSASAGYVISEEKFMEFAKPVLSFLKFRGSYGSVGNQNVGDYRFIPTMSGTTSGWLIGNTNMTTVGTPQEVSRSLSWETVATTDFGADIRFLNNALGVSFDWYKRKTTDMITPGITLPSTYGGTIPTRNYGAMQATGWELAIDWNHSLDNGIRINAMATLSDFREEIIRYSGTRAISGYYDGKLLGEIWGYETDRLFQESDFTKNGNNWIPKEGIPSQTKLAGNTNWFQYGPGDVKYKDLDGSGEVFSGTSTLDDYGDLRVIGNSTPRYQYGLRAGADWKGIDFSFYLQGVGKRELWPSGPVVIPGFNAAEGWYTHQMDYWRADRTGAFYPRPTDAGKSNNSRNFFVQSRYLLDMSYLRLKNISLGYTLPAHLTNRAHIRQARVYISGENLLTWDNLSVPIDPEVDLTAEQTDASSFGRVYPYRKEISFGLQVTF
ncbi:TonB-dependent receptor [Chitinophaga alhagiae]|nr:TonB-dependent receptor [Chitinophaga alhagiae]